MKTVKIGKRDSIGKDEAWCEWYQCPNCKDNNIMHKSKFCGGCGKKLEWEVESD